MSLSALEKFDQLDIPETSALHKLEAYDKTWCEALHKRYAWFLGHKKIMLDEIQKALKSQPDDCEVLNKYSAFMVGQSDINNIKESAWDCHQQFVESVFRHFSDRHAVQLETPKQTMEWKEADEAENIFTPVSLSETVDKVLQQLGGQSFKEKRCQEIIDALRKYVRNKWNDNLSISLKGDAVIVQSDIYWESSSWSPTQTSGRIYNLNPFLQGLSLFDCDGAWTEMHPSLCRFDQYYSGQKSDIFKLFPLSMQKVRGIRFYMNGRVDIKFDTAKNAIAFCEYCGMKV
jgi:hypothetical protein